MQGLWGVRGAEARGRAGPHNLGRAAAMCITHGKKDDLFQAVEASAASDEGTAG